MFFVIGLTSFGGGLVAYLREHLVTRQRWVDDNEFLAALEIGQTLPGLNATNVSVIIGRKLRGPVGAVAAVTGLIIPGVLALGLIGFFYLRHQHDPDVQAVLMGVAAAAVGLLLQVTLKIGRKQLLAPRDLVFLAPVFILVGMFHVSLLAALFIFGPLAIWLRRPRASATGGAPPTPEKP